MEILVNCPDHQYTLSMLRLKDAVIDNLGHLTYTILKIKKKDKNYSHLAIYNYIFLAIKYLLRILYL